MSAVVIATAFGGPDVLEIANQAPGEPGPGEARIQIRAAGVNPVDYKVYSGAMGADPARLPLRLGTEASGVVTAVGPDAAVSAQTARMARMRAMTATVEPSWEEPDAVVLAG